VYADELLAPWYEALRSSLPAVDVFDCHTHVGVNDPSGFSATDDQLLDALAPADARAAVFALKEPDGYASESRSRVSQRPPPGATPERAGAHGSHVATRQPAGARAVGGPSPTLDNVRYVKS
jgi:hypothetical protein